MGSCIRFVALGIFVAFVVFAGCKPSSPSAPASDTEVSNPQSQSSKPIEDVGVPLLSTEQFEAMSKPLPSLIHILAHPDQYHAKETLVQGFLRVQHEGTAIYLSESDDENLITQNAFWVDIESHSLCLSDEQIAKEFNGKWVMLRGTFNKDAHGHMGAYQGEFKGITHLSVKKSRTDWKRFREEQRAKQN